MKKMADVRRDIKHFMAELDASTSWWIIRRLFMVVVGSIIAGFSYSLFQVPYNLAAGGVSGLGIIINQFTGFPVGIIYLLLNVPLLLLGFFTLERWRFLTYTLVSVVVFSVASDLFTAYLPFWLVEYPISDDLLLNAVYAGLLTGVGSGIVYRAGGTMGGTNVIGRLIQRRTGLPLSQTYLYADGLIIVIAGFVFGWDIALHALLIVFLGGIASDFTFEGPSTVRTVTIVTNQPQEVANALMEGLKQGASHWSITGSYTGNVHSMVMCTVYRSQVNDMRQIVATADPYAFVVVGQAHQALGGGFRRLKREK
jgi:uncharacterized membrane-anchored protein YitT (DUF2179 family)